MRRPRIHVPGLIMNVLVSVMELFLPRPPITSDQLRMMAIRNVAEPDAVEKTFGFTPKGLEGNIDYVKSVGMGDGMSILDREDAAADSGPLRARLFLRWRRLSVPPSISLRFEVDRLGAQDERTASGRTDSLVGYRWTRWGRRTNGWGKMTVVGAGEFEIPRRKLLGMTVCGGLDVGPGWGGCSPFDFPQDERTASLVEADALGVRMSKVLARGPRCWWTGVLDSGSGAGMTG